METTNKPWKAIYGAVLAFLTGVLTAVQTTDGEAVQVTVAEWLTAAIAAITAFGGVYFIDNKWGT